MTFPFGRAALLYLLATVAAFASDTLAVPFRSVPFADACKAADAEHKLVFVDFYTTWCGPCKMLDSGTWTDAGVGKLVGDHAVALKIDAEKEADLAARYAIRAYPTMLLLKPDGTEVDRLVGYRDPAVFTLAFSNILAGKSTEAVARALAVSADANPEKRVQARYDLGKLLAQKGKDAEALTEFLWCFDDGMANLPAYSGVRVSFLLSSLQQLGASYPPALDALRTRRDDAEKAMAADPTSRKAATDYASLNHALAQDARTMDLFNSLPKDDARRALLGIKLFDTLVAARRYDDALSANPYARMDLIVTMMSQPRPAMPPRSRPCRSSS